MKANTQLLNTYMDGTVCLSPQISIAEIPAGCIIGCQNDDPASNVPHTSNAVSEDLEALSDSIYLKRLRERRTLIQYSPKSNSSLLSLTCSELSECGGASRNYPEEAGLKWRHNRVRSGNSAMSSLSSISSDGQMTNQSSRAIQLSRKFQFLDINELAGSGEVDKVVTAPAFELANPCLTTSLPVNSSNLTPPKFQRLTKTPQLGNGIYTELPTSNSGTAEESHKHCKERAKSVPNQYNFSTRSPQKPSFSLKQLVPEFIRKRRFSLTSLRQLESARSQSAPTLGVGANTAAGKNRAYGPQRSFNGRDTL